MPNGDSKGPSLTPKSTCWVIESRWLTLEIWQIPHASVFPPEKGTNDTYPSLRTLTVLAGSFRLLQDVICLIHAKNYCRPPSLIRSCHLLHLHVHVSEKCKITEKTKYFLRGELITRTAETVLPRSSWAVFRSRPLPGIAVSLSALR